MFSLLVRRVISSLILLAVTWQSVQGIVGGEEASASEFPHQALLGYTEENSTGYEFKCGGSLISDQYVLTAANCFSRGPPVVVRLGESNLKNDNDGQVDYDIETFVKYAEHRFSRSYHDIALVKLKQKVKISDRIRPACLWRSPVLGFDTVIATGFGHLEYQAGNMSDTLQKVELDILDKSECTELYTTHRKFNRGIIDEQLCVGFELGGRDTCLGDSGGPIQVTSDGSNCTHSIVGITSIGRECGIGRAPAIYTRVSSYIDWIEKIVWPKP